MSYQHVGTRDKLDVSKQSLGGMRSPEADNRVQLLRHGLKVSLGLHHDRARRAHGGTSERGRSERRDSKHVELRAMTVLRAGSGGRRQTLNRGFRITLRLVVCPGRATLWTSEAVLDGQKSKRLDGHASVPRGRVRMLALANERIRIMKVIFDDTRCRHCYLGTPYVGYRILEYQ